LGLGLPVTGPSAGGFAPGFDGGTDGILPGVEPSGCGYLHLLSVSLQYLPPLGGLFFGGRGLKERDFFFFFFKPAVFNAII
jgi:hypothetical protein